MLTWVGIKLTTLFIFIYLSSFLFSDGEECCDNANTEDCKTACTNIFQNELSPSKFEREQLLEFCEISSPKVTECIKDVIKVTPAMNTQKRKFFQNILYFHYWISISFQFQIYIAVINLIIINVVTLVKEC